MTTTLSVLDLIADVHRHGARLTADADGELRLKGRVCSGLHRDLRVHLPQLLAVLSRFHRMAAHDASHDRPPVPMVYWPHHAAPGHCQSCGQTLDHPRAIGRCDSCEVAAELFHRTRAARTAADGQASQSTRRERTPR